MNHWDKQSQARAENSRRHGIAAGRDRRRQALEELRGRCAKLTVSQAVRRTGLTRRTVLNYAAELGEEFLPEPVTHARHRKGREQSASAELIRLARLW